MGHQETGDTIFAPEFQTGIPPGVRGIPSPYELHNQELPTGKGGYVADAVEQALLLLDDMADLRTMKKHKAFLGLKRDLTMVSFSS